MAEGLAGFMMNLAEGVTRLRSRATRARLPSAISWRTTYFAVALIIIELMAITGWAALFTRPYLDLDPNVVPAGREYLSAIQMHTFWDRLRTCGLCALWYGNAGGGLPALADPVASTLHPVVVVTTWIWGVVNGSKLAMVVMFVIAGLGQWHLGRCLNLRRVSRLWAAGMAVVAGFLAARMDQGTFSLVVSTASAVLVFPAVVALARGREWRQVIWLAMALAMVAVGGTGYIQVGLVFLLPAGVLLVPWNRDELGRFARRAGLAVGLALLFAAPVIVPFLHFLPEIAKDFDLGFHAAQPFAYVPINLVVHDTDFYLIDALGKLPWPAHYVNFVGWLPVLLAIWGFAKARNEDEKRTVAFLASAAFLALWIASAAPLAWLVKLIKIEWIVQFLAGIRFTAFIAGLAIPPILGLAAVGLDQLLDILKRRVSLGIEGATNNGTRLTFDVRWLLAIPLVLALNQARGFTGQWIRTVRIEPFVKQVIEALETPNLQWVDVPIGEHYFVTPAAEHHLKLSNDFFRTWHWKDRPVPPPMLEASRYEPREGMQQRLVVEGVFIHQATSEPAYAEVLHANGTTTSCIAQGTGGDIDVTCKTSQAGKLVVTENSWTGWAVAVDGRTADLLDENWLSVEAPAGEHTYSFRYRPRDAYVGASLFAAAIVISGWFLLRDRDNLVGPSSAGDQQ